jgi:PAS domain S-box-containing protein
VSTSSSPDLGASEPASPRETLAALDRYRALFSAIDEGFCVVEVHFDEAQRPVDYRFLETNPGFYRQSKLSDVQGRWMREMAPNLEQYWFEIYGRVALTGESLRFERHSGALDDRWFDVFAFRIDAPEQRHVAILFTDITERRRATMKLEVEVAERKRAELAVQESEAQLRRIIDNMAGFVAMLDSQGVLQEAGEPALRAGGLNRSDVLGRKFWECGWWGPDDEQRKQIAEWVKAAAAGVTVRHDVVARSASGKRLDIDLMLVPVFDSAGNVTHIIPSGIDISDRKRMEDALRENETRLSEAAAALTDADRRKDVFLATLAHELRNPLAPIRTGVQILQLVSSGNSSLRQTTQMMDRQVNHLVRLVDDLLDLSRITRGKIDLQRQPVVVSEIINRALESCEALFDSQNHELHVRFPRLTLCVEGDPDRLTQVFANLLSNAAKFTPHGGSIWLSMREEDDEVVVVVRDAGIGIPPERIEGIFDMFEQVHDSHGNDGLGIGLALVRQIIQLHNGTVSAESAGPGYGSQFTVRLPLLLNSTVADDVQAERHLGDSAGQLPGEAKRRLLVVDDNEDAAQSLERLLRLQGHTVMSCTGGRDAVDLVRRYHPEVVFMDIGMPEVDGLTAARLIRSQPGGSSVRIVAVTGWGQEADRQRTREAGIDEHLVKPVSLDALTRLLAQP